MSIPCRTRPLRRSAGTKLPDEVSDLRRAALRSRRTRLPMPEEELEISMESLILAQDERWRRA